MSRGGLLQWGRRADQREGVRGARALALSSSLSHSLALAQPLQPGSWSWQCTEHTPHVFGHSFITACRVKEGQGGVERGGEAWCQGERG